MTRRRALERMLLGMFGLGGMLAWAACHTPAAAPAPTAAADKRLQLPSPARDGGLSLQAALQARRSHREYAPASLTVAEVGQLLWAAQGITDPHGYRAAPSAGALYPLEAYLVAGNVQELPAGVYRYAPHTHELIHTATGDVRAALSEAALGQEAVQHAAAVIVLSAVYARTTGKYGERGIEYVHIEVGAAAENVYLQAVAGGLGTVLIGAFQDEQVQQVLHLPNDVQPLALLPVGRLQG